MKKTAPRIYVSDYFNQFIKAAANGRRRTASGKRITAGTIQNYRYTQNLIAEF